MRSWVLVFLVLVGTATAEDPRFALFEKYDRASTVDEVRPLVSGTLARQYAILASRDDEVGRALKAQQLASYKPRIVEIDDKTSFLVVEDARSASGARQEAQAYLLSKGTNGGWTLANRFLAASVIKTLWTDTFSPAQFNQVSQCAIDGREIQPRSALAIRDGDVIRITLHPFSFSQGDIEYWRGTSGLPVENAAKGSHFDDGKSTACVLTLRLDKENGISLFNVGAEPRPGAPSGSKVWQASRSDIAKVEIGKNRIVLDTSGQVGAQMDGARWAVKVDLPLWERGL
ncbi:MAG TPA: hypothetical protein VNI20_14095 [Fimbriimonadaceae bacterium]|nr:hypothetical protein [Fimbriimonadaceae bacterium]